MLLETGVQVLTFFCGLLFEEFSIASSGRRSWRVNNEARTLSPQVPDQYYYLLLQVFFCHWWVVELG